MGRPTKLTPELRDRLCEYIRAGNYLATAAELCGVGRSTVNRWLAEGEAEDAPAGYRELRDAVTRARAEAEAQMVSIVQLDARGGAVVREVTRRWPDGTVETDRQLTPPNGRLALEYLARTRPQEWRPVKAVEVSGPAGGPVKADYDVKVIEGLVAKIQQAKARRERERTRESSAPSPQ
ncbi:hypothetical protein [Planomonospora algeriensis]